MPTADDVLSSAPLRWDDELPDRDEASRPLAQKAFDDGRFALDAREATLSNQGASAYTAAQARRRMADAYYDTHRAELLATGSGRALDEHQRTRDIAERVRTGEFATPEAAADAFPDARLDAMKQQQLWAHSIWHQAELPDHPAISANYTPREPTEADIVAFHAGTKPLGDVLRGPRMARSTFADRTSPYGPPGVTMHADGHMVHGTTDPDDVIDRVAQSAALRHMRPDFERFNQNLRSRTKRSNDPVEELSDHGYRMGAHTRVSRDGQMGDHLEDFSGGLARSVLAKHPMQHPIVYRNQAPTERSIHDLEVIAKHRSKVHPTWHR